MADPDSYVTEMLPPIDSDAYHVDSPREPELLTHRMHDHGDNTWQDPEAEERINALMAESGLDVPVDADGTGFDDGDPNSPMTKKQRRRRRIKRALYAFVALFVVLPLVAFTVMYFLVDIPSPRDVAASQGKTVSYLYADGKVMGQDFQDGNRQILDADQIPDKVKHAVYAAEDASFETNAGFDITGILRAAKNQLTGGAGGGSTISQQYVKKATENEERTITRKATEIVKSFKMNNELSKSEIITAYLNTIYFGRGAYGIQAASQAYFKKDVGKLSTSEAAMLAGIIQAPSRGDNRDYAETRWNYVIDQMAEHKWLSEAEKNEAKFPKVISAEKAQLKGFSGPRRHIKERVTAELDALGYSEEKVRLSGYQIHTTIDKRAQELAEKTVKDVMKGEPKQLKEALVAVDPKTGGIRAYYGGPYDAKDQLDWANYATNPGSTMKVFDLLALLKKGEKGPYSVYDGSSPRDFGVGPPVANSGGDQCPRCTVMKAMERSINTVFYDMVVNDVTPAEVVKAAREAGLKSGKSKLAKSHNIAIGGGSTQVTPRDMAAAFATFSADGIQHDSHFVDKIVTPDGEVVYDARFKGKPAFDSDREKSKRIAGNLTKTLVPVLPSSGRACAAGRACAGKTGTHEYVPKSGEPDLGDNSQAWMAGYTRQLSAAAWVGTGGNNKIRNMNGGKIFGSGLPGAIWQRFMDAYHEGMPNEPFPEVKLIGEAAPPPPPPPQPEPEPEPEPSEEKPSDKPDKTTKPEKPTETPSNSPEPTPPGCGRPICPPSEDGGDEDGEPERSTEQPTEG